MDDEDLRDGNSNKNSTDTSNNGKAIASTSPSAFTCDTAEADLNIGKDEENNITRQHQDATSSKENDTTTCKSATSKLPKH
eukprot:13745982-Ditylum_brightwellii.AAC.1